MFGKRSGKRASEKLSDVYKPGSGKHRSKVTKLPPPQPKRGKGGKK